MHILDMNGKAVDRDKPWLDAIEHLISAFPHALNRRDSGGRLPLHIAVDRKDPCKEGEFHVRASKRQG